MRTSGAELSRELSIAQIELLLKVSRRGREMNLELAGKLRQKLAAREAAASRRARRPAAG